MPKAVSNLDDQLKADPHTYKQLYLKIYKFYLVESKEGSLKHEEAYILWRMYLKPIMPLYDKFMQYLDQKAVNPVRVHRDLWNMVY